MIVIEIEQNLEIDKLPWVLVTTKSTLIIGAGPVNNFTTTRSRTTNRTQLSTARATHGGAARVAENLVGHSLSLCRMIISS